MSRVHKVHTLNPGCAHSAQVMSIASCGSTRRHVVWQQPPPRHNKKNYVTINSCRERSESCVDRGPRAVLRELLCVSQCSYAVSQGASTLYRNLVVPYCDIKDRPQPRYKPLYRDSPPTARPCTHVAARPARRPVVSQGLLAVSWGRVTRLLALSWLPVCPPTALCNDTTCCIVTQHLIWAVAHSSLPFCTFFFSLIIFFFFVPPTRRPKIKTFFFSFSSRTK